MASNLGSTAVAVEWIRSGTRGQNWVSAGVLRPTRSIWYARYIDWTITTPLLLLELVLATGMPLSQIFGLIFFGTAPSARRRPAPRCSPLLSQTS